MKKVWNIKLRIVIINIIEGIRRFPKYIKAAFSYGIFDYQLFLEKQIKLLAHSIEKGMVIKNSKKGFGKVKAERLLSKMEDYILVEGEALRSSFAFTEGTRVLEKYIAFSEKNDVDINDIKKAYLKLSIHETAKTQNNCTWESVLDEISFEQKLWDDYTRLIRTRHSIRQFSTSVPENILDEVIKITAYSPSACNRQPCKIYYTMDSTKIDIIRHSVMGNKGFEDDIPNYAVITCNRLDFSSNELFQDYVNGGIFLSFFIMSLHAKGIGTCIFQSTLFNKNETKIREITNMNKSDTIIAIVGFGYPDRNSKYLELSRKPLKELGIKF